MPDDTTRALSDAARVGRLADGQGVDLPRDLPALARELRRAQAHLAALDDRVGP